MLELFIALTASGLLVLVLGAFSRPLTRLGVSLPLVALVAGVLLGPEVADLLRPLRWGDADALLLEVARVSLALSVMGIALRLPKGWIQRHWRALAVLLGLGMPLMCLASAALAWALLGVPLVVALLVGALLAPTDPIVASSIVTGELAEENLPEGMRRLLSAESGANDGLAYALVMLPLLWLLGPQQQVWTDWLRVLFWEVGGAIGLGLLLGLAAGRLMRWSEDHRDIERESFLAYTLGLTILALGLGKLVHVEAIVMVFVSGLAFDQVVGARERAEEENIQEALNRFFALPVFVLIGVMLPWSHWHAGGWPLLLFALAVLLLRRLPAWLLLARAVPEMRGRGEALFLGWFGPIGVAAVMYAMTATERLHDRSLWGIVSLCLVVSVLAHSLSSAPAARAFGRRGD